ncbi:uncharacterized protein kek5 [Euwallacea similis]|uniref:uncharacterized protein kek5 n=1 Tax=Euwallacea similis TaxID=1736056 RepID=UPI0034508B84
MSPKLFWLLLTSAALIHPSTSDTDWTKECNNCSCIWVSGRKTANCSNKGFVEIPKDLSNGVRDIDFSNNPLYKLKDGEFVSAKLVDIHKLKFQNCSIELLNEGAFKRLALIIELDLSRNMIVELKKDTFRDNTKLRILILSYNKIKELKDGLFSNMSYIQRIHIDHNEISFLTENTFHNLPTLTDISLGYNKLKTVNFDLKKKLPRLNSLNVAENPWVCDCRLETFHRSVVQNNLITHETKCEEPPKLRGRQWTIKEQFPCSPVIVHPLQSMEIIADTSNVTLTCKVLGEPTPDVDWTNNGRIVEREPRKSKQKYVTSKSKTGEYTWNNLTIINVSFKDRGEYKCIAKNPGGEDEKNVTLVIDSLPPGTFTDLGSSSGLIIGLSVGLIILLIIILILVCLFCRKGNNNALQSKRNELGGSSQEAISLSENNVLKKGLITDVNPVSKPPRAPVLTSVVSGGTEVSDVKRNLLDDESVFDYDDEVRSDFDQPLLQKSYNQLVDPDYRFAAAPAPYPPDLLSFPPRSQISPAGSNASTVILDARLPPPHGPQSPLHSPLYDQLSMYKTLPYSRSHSPFTPGLGMARVPRQGAGYVTIPRRPRQSWSSEPPPSSEIIAEPVYDNLGMRTTADGSSVLSLNKAGSEAASTPRSARMFALSPPVAIGPIVESQESALQLDHTKSSPTSERKPLPSPRQSQTPVKTKPKVPLKPSGTQTLPRNLHEMKVVPSTPVQNSPKDKRSSVVSDTPSVEEGKPKKIPPRPPPKPPKRVKSSGPLFEDEGEDGTEV